MIEKMKMRSSRVLKKLRAGEVALSTKMNLSDPRAAAIAALSGFDCVWTCQEHIGNDYRMINEQIMAAKAYDCDLVCRVPKGSYSDFVRPLEMDASGIMVPHLMSLEEAKKIVKMTRFYPVGRRPLDGGNSDGLYCQIPMKDYIEQANRERLVILQIEDPEPLEELDAIADLPGYDMLFFGPGDFSHSIGDTANFDNPLIQETFVKIAETARKYGKFAGTVGHTGNYRELVDMGYNFINIGADVLILAEGYKSVMKELGRSGASSAKSIYSKDK